MVSLLDRLSQQTMVSRKRYLGIISIYVFSCFAVWTLATFWSRPRAGASFLPHHTVDNNTITDPNAGSNQDQDLTNSPSSPLLKLPNDYFDVDEQAELCTKRLGLGYLEGLRHARATYCSPESTSQVTCFHSQTDKSSRMDSFCIVEGAKINDDGKKFLASCNKIDPIGIETKKASVKLSAIPPYWYETGPRIILDKFINLNIENIEPSHEEPQKFTALVKREGSGNPWHSLMEIMSLSMTFDVLQFSPGRKSEGGAFITPDDAANTQVVILDDGNDGPYFDLWRLFAKKPTVRLSALPAGSDVGNIIIPLPGASNPIWQGDWEPNTCTHSELLRTFARRVLKHFQIKTSVPKPDSKIVVTLVDRKGTRKLVNTDKHIAALKSRYKHADIRLIDFAAMPLVEQIQAVRDTDVLAGVHGAGLTHAMWMKEHSVLAEILPKDFMHKGFRNVAGSMGIGYFSAHGTQAGGGDGKDWQTEDVEIEEAKLFELMDVAVKSIYNTGPHNYDVYK